MVCRVGMRRLLALGGRKFSIDAFMAGQSDGFYFDFTRTDRHFQEHTGPTLADDVGEVIGLALDQRMWAGQTLAQIISAAPELCVNGGFDTDLAGWTDASSGTTVTWSAGRASLNAGGTARLRQGIAITAGRIMRFAGALVSGSIAISLGSSAGGTQYVNQVAGASTVLFATTSGAAFWIGWYGGGPTLVDDNSVREVSRYSALQSTGTMKPTRQSSGAKFDGSDDNLLTTYYATSGANFIAASVSVPATLSAVQVIAGASGSGANRTFLAIDTSGRVCAGVGSDSTTVHVGTTDLRGTDTVIALSYDGTTVRLFAGSTLEYSGPQASTPTTTIPYRIGSLNSNGTAASFSAAAIKRIVVGREFLTTLQFAQLAPALRG